MNLKDVAKAAGVSPMTVSNVLNGRASVREENRQKVLAAIDQLGYTPNVIAQQLRRGRTNAIGVIVPEAINPFYGDLARGVEQCAFGSSVEALVMTSHDSFERECRLLDLLSGMLVHGIVMASVSNWPSLLPRVRSLRGREVAMAVLATEADVEGLVSSVTGDDRLGGELAGRHLAELNCDRILFVGDASGPPVLRKRYAGMLEGLEAGGARDVTVTDVALGDLSLEGGYRLALEVLSRPDRPSAVFCANDLIALGFLRGAVDHGVPVPDGLAIIGYDDIPFAAGASVPLTSLRQPTREMGVRAAELVLQQADGGSDDVVHCVFPPTLEVRASTLGAVDR